MLSRNSSIFVRIREGILLAQRVLYFVLVSLRGYIIIVIYFDLLASLRTGVIAIINSAASTMFDISDLTYACLSVVYSPAHFRNFGISVRILKLP